MADRGGPPSRAPAEGTDREVARREEVRRRLDRYERRHGPQGALMAARNQSLDQHALVMDLLHRAERDRTRDPVTCRQWAELAVEKAETLDSPALRAQAWAEKGNSERILEDFVEARASFDRAREILQDDDGGLLSVRGDVLSLQASLEHSLRRPHHALGCLEEAQGCYRILGSNRDLWKVKVKRANVFFYQGRLPTALDEAGAVLSNSLDDSAGVEKQTLLAASHVVVLTLVEVALTAASPADRRLALDVATEHLVHLSGLYRCCSEPVWRMRYRWIEGRLLAAKGRAEEAEEVLDRVVAQAIDQGFGATAAVASLDLALVLARRGRWERLREVARATCAALEAGGLKADARTVQRMLLDCDRAEAESLIIQGLQRAGSASLRRNRTPRTPESDP